MKDDTLIMRGAPVRPLPRPNRLWSSGRVCSEEGCVTRLSIYNKTTLCWQHEPVKYHLARGKRKSKHAEAA
jgi:hypothetical protein